MDEDDIRKLLVRTVRDSVAAWAKVPAMLESGRLVKGSGSWYRVKDARVYKEVSTLIQGFKADKTGVVTHVKLSKPSKKLIALVSRNP